MATKKSTPEQAAQDARAEQLTAAIEQVLQKAKQGGLPPKTPRDFTNEGARKTAESAERKRKSDG